MCPWASATCHVRPSRGGQPGQRADVEVVGCGRPQIETSSVVEVDVLAGSASVITWMLAGSVTRPQIVAGHEAVVVAGQDDDRHADAAHLVHQRLPHLGRDPVVVERVADQHDDVDVVGDGGVDAAASTGSPLSTGCRRRGCRRRAASAPWPAPSPVSDDGASRRRARAADRRCTGRRARRARRAGPPRWCVDRTRLIDGVRWAIESYSAPSIAAVRMFITSDHRFVMCLCTDSMSRGLSATRWQKPRPVASSSSAGTTWARGRCRLASAASNGRR